MDNQQQTLFNEASFSVGLVKSMVDKWIPQDDKIIHNQQLLSHSFVQPKPALLYTSSLKSDKATKKLEAIKHQVELNRLKKLEIQETIMKHSQVEGFNNNKYTHSLTHTFTPSHTHSHIHSITHTLPHSLTHSIIHSLNLLFHITYT